MVETAFLLHGTVEIDETYIGGKSKRRSGAARNQKRRNEKFDMVLGPRTPESCRTEPAAPREVWRAFFSLALFLDQLFRPLHQFLSFSHGLAGLLKNF
jgi:hypothetical protein